MFALHPYQVAISFVLLFVVLFVLAKLQFFYFGSFFADGSCDTLQNCFFSTLKLALTKSFSSTLNQHHPTRVRKLTVSMETLALLLKKLVRSLQALNAFLHNNLELFDC